jgi:hypothetical protein
MVIMIILEIVGSAVGLYNLAKGVINIYSDAEEYRRQQEEYNKYIEMQKKTPDLLTKSQYECFVEGFEII